jgi:Ca2+-binding EF-hand superfamily protein
VREAAEVNAISPDVEQGPLEAGTLQQNNTFNDAIESNVRFIQDIMTRYDTDGDGFLSKAETKSLMADLNSGKQPTEAAVSNKQFISYNVQLSSEVILLSLCKVLMVFASCDLNKDGKIGLDELTKVLVVFMAHTSKDKEGGQWGSHWFAWRLWQWAKAFFLT